MNLIFRLEVSKMTSKQIYVKVKSSDVPECLRDSPVLDLNQEYVYFPAIYYIESLDVNSIEDYRKIFNSMNYFLLDLPDTLKSFEMNNPEETFAYLFQFREFPEVKERLELIKKYMLRSQSLYTGCITSSYGNDIHVTGNFDNIKDCIDSLIIYLVLNNFLFRYRYSFPNSSEILDILGNNRDNEEDMTFKTNEEKITFLMKYINTEEDLIKICNQYSNQYNNSSIAGCMSWNFLISKRDIGSVYSPVLSVIENKHIVDSNK